MSLVPRWLSGLVRHPKCKGANGDPILIPSFTGSDSESTTTLRARMPGVHKARVVTGGSYMQTVGIRC